MIGLAIFFEILSESWTMEFDLNFRRTFDTPFIGYQVSRDCKPILKFLAKIWDWILTDIDVPQQKIVRVRQVVYTIDQRKQKSAQKNFI